MNRYQIAPKEQSDWGPYCLQYMLKKIEADVKCSYIFNKKNYNMKYHVILGRFCGSSMFHSV